MAEAYPIEWLHRIAWRMGENEPYSLSRNLYVKNSIFSRGAFYLQIQVNSNLVGSTPCFF